VVYSLNKSDSETANTLIPTKNFFWCSSTNYIFSSLPTVNESDRQKLSKFSTLFSGEFDTVLVESNHPPKVIDAEAGIVLPPKHLTELDRLSITVQEIDRACFCVPRGALKYNPLHVVSHNEAFKGLSTEESNDLANWQHFRQVEHHSKKELIARDEAVYSDNFLDSIAEDKPTACWSLLRDTTGSVAVLRSQLWPGYYAYHRSNTAVYGSAYIGDGIQNIDLPFMQ